MSIKNYIDTDYNFANTPDLPYLRYHGASIKVFLWDNLTSEQELDTILHGNTKKVKPYRSAFPQAVTSAKFLPWYNIQDTKDSFQAYCLEEFVDTDFVNLPDYSLSKPLPIKGKILNVSLDTLTQLDVWYNNEQEFDRVLIDVHASVYSKNTLKCFAWFNTTDHLTDTQNEFDTDRYDFTPFRTEDISNKEYYVF